MSHRLFAALAGAPPLPLLAALSLLALTAPTQCMTFTVDSLADRTDDVVGDGICATEPPVVCTLRAAVVEANYLTGADEIALPAGHYRLTLVGESSIAGSLDIEDDVTISGAGASQTIVDANGIDRVFVVDPDQSAIFEDLTITGGVALPPVRAYSFLGGGIYARERSEVVLKRCNVTRNQAELGGGLRLLTGSSLTLQDTLISENSISDAATLSYHGAGAALERTSQLVMERSTVSGNTCDASAPGCHGGLYLACDAASGLHAIRNSTVSGNESSGIWTGPCHLELNNTTIYGNDDGLVYNGSATSELTVANSIIAVSRNQDCTLISGVLSMTGGHNVDSDNTCGLNALAGDKPGVDPILAPLTTWSGYTPIHLPDDGSPALQNGDNATCEVVDQDGFGRPDGYPKGLGTCEIGSVEHLACVGSVNLHLMNETPPPGQYEACVEVRADPDVTLIAGDFTFRARYAVVLGEGFTVMNNATLAVEIDRAAGSGL